MSAIPRRVPAHILACHWDTDGLQWNCQKSGVVAICNLWLFGQTSWSFEQLQLDGTSHPTSHFNQLSWHSAIHLTDWWLVCASLQQEQRGEESEFCPELATAGQWIVLWQPFCLIWFYDSICAVWLAGRCSSNLFVWYLILSVLSSSSSSALTTLLSDTTMILSVLSWWLDGALATFLSDSTSLILLWFYLCCIGEWTVLWQQSWQLDPTLQIICA